MFNLLSASNVFTKLILFIISFIFILLINNVNTLFILVLILTTLLITKQNKYNYLTVILLTIFIYMFKLKIILKLIIIIYYYLISKKYINLSEKIYLIEKLFYKYPFIFLNLLKLIYFEKEFKNNYYNFIKIEKEYGMINKNSSFNKIKQVLNKTKVDLREISNTYRSRFYKTYNSKTLPIITFDVFDILYITLHIFIFIIILLLGVK